MVNVTVSMAQPARLGVILPPLISMTLGSLTVTDVRLSPVRLYSPYSPQPLISKSAAGSFGLKTVFVLEKPILLTTTVSASGLYSINPVDSEVRVLLVSSAADFAVTDTPVSYTHLDVYKRQENGSG